MREYPFAKYLSGSEKKHCEILREFFFNLHISKHCYSCEAEYATLNYQGLQQIYGVLEIHMHIMCEYTF